MGMVELRVGSGVLRMGDDGPFRYITASGRHLEPLDLLECEMGTYYAYEYVCVMAVQEGKGGHDLVRLFSEGGASYGAVERVWGDPPPAH